ncbi:MAG: hypothetical protein ACPGWR_09030 [Ardenticatenaceae bacterium]
MKYTPIGEKINQKIISVTVISILYLFIEDLFFLFILTLGLFSEIIKFIFELSKWNKFKSSPKETTQAKIVDCRVVESRGKHTTSYTHYITYQFEDMADRKTFTFEEKVSEEVYNRVSIGKLLTVQYAIADPRLARRRYSKF